MRKRDFFRAIMGWDKICKNDYPHKSVCRLSFFQFFIIFFSCDRTYALEHVEPKYPSFQEYFTKLHSKLCKVVPELYLEIKWRCPDTFIIRGLYYVKKSAKSETLYLKQGFYTASWYFAIDTPIYGDEKSRPTKWKLTYRLEDRDAVRIDGEPIEKWPYETFDREDVWGE